MQLDLVAYRGKYISDKLYEWCDLMASNKWFTLRSNNPLKAELEIIFLNAGSLTVN